MALNKTLKSENLIMIEALKAMQSLGGKLTRKEIKREIRDHSKIISEETVDEVKISKKSGSKYHPLIDMNPISWTKI
ncbi:hypothetical protein BGL46_03325 [Fructilactobacillus sanfranciscensis]|nr:hypothetical protein BGL46_03325 [Fructilactobacillus sanfranciscensis]